MNRNAWMFTALLLVSLATLPLMAQEQFGPPASGNTSAILFAPATLKLVAGLNGAGYGGDGGPANSATSMLSYPVGIAYDSNGNLFIADQSNHVVRRIDHGTGDISTFAGQQANPGFSIGGGVATNAQMQAPSGLVVDTNNNVYVADRSNNVVFKITAAGVISIFAGSGNSGYGGDGGSATAPAAEFNNIWALGIDANNNIYIADTGNNLIRKVTQAGNLSTFAGDVADVSGCSANEYSTAAPPYTALQAHLCFPQGVAFDPLGNAYITDTKNDIIRKVDNTGNLTLFAGTFRTPGFSGDGGPATSAWFNLPAGLYIDPAGRVYISDFFNNRIRVVDTLGNINTVFGDGFGSLNAGSIGEPDTEAVNVTSGPANGIYDFVLDQDGNIIATDSSSNAVTSAGTTGQYDFADQFVFDPSPVKDVTVENPSGVPLDFLGTPTLTGPYSLATGASAGTCNFSGTLPAGETCTIGILFTPIVDDAKNPGSLTLTTNANSSPSTISLFGMSYGTGITSASLTGPGPSFTATVGQTSAPQQATLKNTGQTAITITSTSFTGIDPTEFAISSTTCPTSPATLASGASCVFNLTFTPVNTTVAGAAFNVTIANYGQIGVSLDGVGTPAGPAAATPVISPASGTYNAPVAVQITDSSANSTIYYTTTGSAPVVGTSPTYSSVVTVTQSGTEVQAIATAAGDSTSNAATPTTYTVQPFIVFNPAMVGISAGSAQQLTAQFSFQGIVAPTASLHYGHDYSMGTFNCTPNGTIEICSVSITFIPTLPGARKDALFLMNGGTRVATVLLDGTGQAPFALIQPGVVTQAINTHGNGLFNSVVDENGTVYALSSSTNAILVMTKAGVVSNLPVTGLSSPRTISIDGAGVLYIHGSTDDAAMMTYDTVQGVQGSVALPGTHFWLDTSVGNSGNLYALAGETGVLYTIKPDGTSTNATLSPADPGADAMAVDSAEDVFVGGLSTSEITPSGTQTGFSAVDAQNAVIVDAANSIYAAPYSGFFGIVELPASSYNGAPIADLDSTVQLVLGASMRSDGALFVGNGNGLDQVDRSQGAINFGTQIAGTASTAQTVSLYNGGNENLTLTNFVLAGGASGFAIQAASSNPCTVGMTIAPGALCNVAVTLTAPSAGTFSGTVTFTSNTLNTASTNQVVTLSGSVNGINVTAAPNPLNFANQLEGTSSAAQTITLTNNGVSAGATISTPLPTPSGYVLGIGTCNALIPAAGGTCQLTVTFDPTAAQAYDDVVSLTAISAGAGPNQTVNFNVNGTGLAPSAPVASLSPVTLPFGNATTGTTSTPMSTTLSNTGNAALNITGVTIVGANPSDFAVITAAGSCGSTLAAGSNCLIWVEFIPQSVAGFTATLQVADDATGSPQTATLSGTGTAVPAPAAALSPGSLPFGNATSGTTSTPMSATLSNTGNATLNITGVSIVGANPSDFAVITAAGSCGSTLVAGSSCLIWVEFIPQSASSFTATLQVADNAAGSPQTATLSGTGTAVPAPVAGLTPATVPFGSLTAGTTSAPMSLMLSNTGNATLNITGIAIAGANPADFAVATGANACGTTLAAGANCSIYVTFTPAAASSFAATLQVTDNAAGSPQASALTGTGVAPPAPAATFAPNPVAFASETIGATSAATTVTLTNSGNATLTITGISIAGTNPTDFATTTGSNACGSSVAAGASCNIYVTFTPAGAASYSATLSVADNAAASPQTVALTGSGLNPADFGVNATPASQTVAPGGSTTFAVTVDSTGGTFSNAVGLAVSGLPAGATGSFSPSSVTPGSESAASTLTVQAGTGTQQTASNSAWPLAAPALAAIGLFFVPGKRRRRWITLGVLFLASLGTLTALSGCGGGFSFTKPAQTYTLTITGTSGNDTHSTTVQLTVQ
jgi:hypothetical protein